MHVLDCWNKMIWIIKKKKSKEWNNEYMPSYSLFLQPWLALEKEKMFLNQAI